MITQSIIVLFRGDIPVLIAYRPGYCRPTCAGGTEVVSIRAVGTPVCVCVCVCVCVYVRIHCRASPENTSMQYGNRPRKE